MISRLLIHPSLEKRQEEIEKNLAQLGLSKNHPDVLYFSADAKLGIEQVRKIIGHFSIKPYSAKGRVVVLENAESLTIDAQNALLKILEEPPEQALLILGAKSESDLLPTILSRCQIVILEGAQRPIESNPDIAKLLQSSTGERFEYIEKLKDKDQFLNDLVLYFREQLASGKTEYTQFIRELLQAEKWAKANVNIRAILEYLMLVMPK